MSGGGTRTRARVRSWLTTAVAALILASPSAAFADARTEARAHFKKGMEAISAGKYDDGIAELKAAYEISPHPNVLYNIARVLHDKGLDIHRSKVGVEADRVADIFYVRDRATGQKISDPERLADITESLRKALERKA